MFWSCKSSTALFLGVTALGIPAKERPAYTHQVFAMGKWQPKQGESQMKSSKIQWFAPIHKPSQEQNQSAESQSYQLTPSQLCSPQPYGTDLFGNTNSSWKNRKSRLFYPWHLNRKLLQREYFKVNYSFKYGARMGDLGREREPQLLAPF